MSEIRFEPKKPPELINLFIKDIELSIAPVISASEFMKIIEACNNEKTDYKILLAQILYNRLHKRPEAESVVFDDVLNLSDEFFNEFIEAVLDHYKDIRVAYDQVDSFTSNYERFAKSFKKYAENNLIAAFKNVNYDVLIDNVINWQKQIQRTIEQVISPALASLARYTKSIIESSTLSVISDTLEKFRNIILQTKTPSLTEEEKKNLILSYQKWGEYGWTPPIDFLDGFFDETPLDRKTANKTMLKYCNKHDMEMLFCKLKTMKGVKQSDLNEAIFDFENGKYKSCIMIIYSLIDAKLIRTQKPEDYINKTKKSQRSLGGIAAETILNRLYDLKGEETPFYFYLLCANIISCIKELYKHGNDFKKQPKDANRNFIMHGMFTRPVQRVDCVKVFLLYYNLTQIIIDAS